MVFNQLKMVSRTSSLLVFIFLIVSGSALGKPFIPQQSDYVLAKWTVADNNSSTVSLTEIENLIAQAQFPGNSAYNIGRAKALLQAYQKNNPENTKVRYLSARIFQHQHQFKLALGLLNKLLQSEPMDVNAWLLKANIQLALGNPQAARQSCLTLLGVTDLLTVASCNLEVESFQGKLAASYDKLSGLAKRYGLADDESGVWTLQILADMAARLGNYTEAVGWLEHYTLDKKPTSFWVLWADLQLQLNQESKVLATLSEVVNQAEFKDDALLLRLAIAEKRLFKSDYWIEQMAQRIQLRDIRHDNFHAAELARYFIEVDINPEKALYWADINWQMSKLEADKKLLQQAISLQADTPIPQTSMHLVATK